MEKIALITGAAKRVGCEIAKQLHKKGWKVIIHYNNSETLARRISSELPNTKIIRQDLSHTNQIHQFYERAKLLLGNPTLLINNASIFDKEDGEINLINLEKNMRINCFAPILLAQEFAKNGGKNIINITDSFCQKPSSKFLSYNLSKAALDHVTKSLALLLAPHCRVNAISPGLIIAPEDPELKKGFYELISRTLTKDITKIEDILKAIDFIITTESMTGHNIFLDSGLSS